MRQVLIRPKGRRDLRDIYQNLAETLGIVTAEQFETNAIQTFFDLARMPNVGALRKLEGIPTRDWRMWRIRDFEEYLVFYYLESEVVYVERIVHAKRDYRRQV